MSTAAGGAYDALRGRHPGQGHHVKGCETVKGETMDFNHVETLVRQIVEAQLLYNWRYYGVLLGVVIIGGAAVSFVAPYLKTRGQSFATKADFDRLLDQLVQTTEVTEKIRSAVSLDDWKAKELKSLRRMKLEELLLAVYECEHWLNLHGDQKLFGQKLDLAPDPKAKVATLAMLYFPEISMLEFNDAQSAFKAWHTGIQKERVVADQAQDVPAFAAAMARVDKEYGGYYQALMASIAAVERQAQALMQSDILK